MMVNQNLRAVVFHHLLTYMSDSLGIIEVRAYEEVSLRQERVALVRVTLVYLDLLCTGHPVIERRKRIRYNDCHLLLTADN